MVLGLPGLFGAGGATRDMIKLGQLTQQQINAPAQDSFSGTAPLMQLALGVAGTLDPQGAGRLTEPLGGIIQNSLGSDYSKALKQNPYAKAPAGLNFKDATALQETALNRRQADIELRMAEEQHESRQKWYNEQMVRLGQLNEQLAIELDIARQTKSTSIQSIQDNAAYVKANMQKAQNELELSNFELEAARTISPADRAAILQLQTDAIKKQATINAKLLEMKLKNPQLRLPWEQEEADARIAQLNDQRRFTVLRELNELSERGYTSKDMVTYINNAYAYDPDLQEMARSIVPMYITPPSGEDDGTVDPSTKDKEKKGFFSGIFGGDESVVDTTPLQAIPRTVEDVPDQYRIPTPASVGSSLLDEINAYEEPSVSRTQPEPLYNPPSLKDIRQLFSERPYPSTLRDTSGFYNAETVGIMPDFSPKEQADRQAKELLDTNLLKAQARNRQKEFIERRKAEVIGTIVDGAIVGKPGKRVRVLNYDPETDTVTSYEVLD